MLHTVYEACSLKSACLHRAEYQQIIGNDGFVDNKDAQPMAHHLSLCPSRNRLAR